MIVVIATIRAREGHESETEPLLRMLVEETRKEPGCIQYELHRSTSDPRAFAFYERWESPEALAEHFKTPHFTAAAGRVGDLCVGPPEIATYNLIS